MTQITTTTPNDLPFPATILAQPLEHLLSASGRAFMGIYNPHGAHRDVGTLREGIAGAERLLANADALAGQLRDAVEPESLEQIGRQLEAFGSAWPNVSKSDLAVFGGLLAQDVVERQPCRYALRSALRHLRQTSRFMPAIAEVLAEIDRAQAKARDTVFHLRELPAALERARADLVAVEARQHHARLEGSP